MKNDVRVSARISSRSGNGNGVASSSRGRSSIESEKSKPWVRTVRYFSTAFLRNSWNDRTTRKNRQNLLFMSFGAMLLVTSLLTDAFSSSIALRRSSFPRLVASGVGQGLLGERARELKHALLYFDGYCGASSRENAAEIRDRVRLYRASLRTTVHKAGIPHEHAELLLLNDTLAIPAWFMQTLAPKAAHLLTQHVLANSILSSIDSGSDEFRVDALNPGTQQSVNDVTDLTNYDIGLAEGTTPKLLVVHPQLDLANRLRVVASAMEFAYSTGRVLVVLWPHDKYMTAPPESIFSTETLERIIFVQVDPFDDNDMFGAPPIPRGHVSYEDSTFSYWNRMHKDTRVPISRMPPVVDVPGKHMYIKTAHALGPSSSAPDIFADELLYSLQPSDRVSEVINSLTAQVGPLEYRIAVHLATRLSDRPASATDPVCDISSEELRTAQRVARLSSPTNAVNRIRAILSDRLPTMQFKVDALLHLQHWIQESPARLLRPWFLRPTFTRKQPLTFFMACDNQAVSNHMQRQMERSFSHTHVISYNGTSDKNLPAVCDRSQLPNLDCTVATYAKYIVLARCGTIILSRQHPVSDLIARLANVHRKHTREGYTAFVSKILDRVDTPVVELRSGIDFGMWSDESGLQDRHGSSYFQGVVREQARLDDMRWRKRCWVNAEAEDIR